MKIIILLLFVVTCINENLKEEIKSLCQNIGLKEEKERRMILEIERLEIDFVLTCNKTNK